jgi:outer membrane biosynthesis protein TonB
MAFNQQEDDIKDFESAFKTDSDESTSDLNPPSISKNFSFDKSEKIVYFKNPWIQIAILSIVAVPGLWIILSVFDSPKQTKQATASVVDEEIVRLQNAIAELEEKNRSLQLQQALSEQEAIEVVVPPPPEPEPVKNKAEEPKPRPAPPPKTVVKTRPAPPPKTVAKPRPAPPPEPEIEPMEEWAKRANQGLYASSNISFRQPGAADVVKKNKTQYVASRTAYSQKNLKPEDRNIQNLYSREGRLFSDTRVRERIENNSLYTKETVKERLQQPINYSSAMSQAQNIETVISDSSVIASNNRETQTLDISSTAKAKINSSITWTSEHQNYERKYLITLEEGFKNIAGEEILAKGTRLIAKAQNLNSSGLIDLEVVEIIKTTGEKINVPPGVLMVEGKNGSPLKADLKRKGDSNVLAELGSVIAPGVEEALDTTADSISFNGENNSFSRISNRDRSPLASGISGVAEGTGRALDRRLSRNRRESVVSYFQLDSGTTVNLVVYEDLNL